MEPVRKLDRSVKGRAVLVTGAASGMGRATAHVFADEGAQVAVTDVNEAGVASVVEEIKAKGGVARGWRLDVLDAGEIKRVVAEVAARFGRLDIVINNAGFGGFHPLDGPDYDAIWDRSIAGLLTAQQRIVRAALPYLRKSDAARIVNIASTEGLGATPGDSPYAVAKTGVIGLTRALAVDLGPEGITVNCICPGPIRTALTDAIPEEHKTIFGKRRTALKRYGFPEEVAHMTLSLCLPAASYLTGAVIPVDGGLTIRNA
ncbi:MAG TPA: SDR family NAD(P)-dependent oxidoreductase [Candidatus Acidoferrales bacterium]|nr:SDR family NAD(P)-dependent oxidoreductase [Candidatus Acidoferrales bacterium]